MRNVSGKRHIIHELNNFSNDFIEHMRAMRQQHVTVHRQHNVSANSSVFTGHHLHLATLSAVQPAHIQIHTC